MRKVLVLLISLLVLTPVRVYATEEVTKTYCSSVPSGADSEAVKQEILAAAKRMAINDLFGELIIANVAVEDFVVTSDQIQSTSVGFVRTKNVRYFNRGGEQCVTITAYATAEDLARFEPFLINKRYCDSDPALTVSALRRLVRDEVVIQALLDYNRALEEVEHAKLLRLLERVQYTEDGFLQNTETYCASIEGYVLPVAVFALLNATHPPTVTPTPTPEPSPTNNPTWRATTSRSTVTPNWTATRFARPTQTAAARATIVQITIEAIQEATRVQQEVEAQLTRLAPAASPTLQATNTVTPSPQPVHTPTPVGPRVEIIADDLNIRSGPGTGYDRVGKVSTGQVLVPVGRDSTASWLQVCCVNGQPGWVVNNPEYVTVTGDLSRLAVITPPTPIPPPAPIACSIPVDAELVGRWNRDEMGCPTGPAQVIWSSYTPFERGYMMWRRDTNAAYGFYNSGRWKQVADQWDGISPAPSRGSPPPGLTAPTRGTGYVWGLDDELFQNLGWATGQQTGLCSRVQSFDNGFILRSSTAERCHEEHQNPIRDANFLFFEAYNAGYWRR